MSSERRILIWMCVLVAVNQLGFGAMVPSLPLYARSFGVPASAVGLAIAVYGLARFASAVPSGQWSDRFGRRPTLAVGGLISALGGFWCAEAYGFADFIVARFVAGAGAGIILTTGQIVLADISAPDRRGRNIAIFQAAFLFGFGVGPFPGGLLAERYGLAAPFLATGFTSLLVTGIAWWLVSETRSGTPGPRRTTADGAEPYLAQMLQLLRQRGFLLVSLISLMQAVVRTGGLFALIPLFATSSLGLSVSQIGFAMMLGGAFGLAAAYPAGWLTDRFGRKSVIVPATVLTGTSMLMFCAAPSYAWFTAASIIWSMASSIGGSAPAAYAADSAPPGMNAVAMSTYRMTADFGYIVGPLGLGLLADIFTPATAIIMASALLVAIGALFAVAAPETHRYRVAAAKG